jgi:hypothetical protein
MGRLLRTMLPESAGSHSALGPSRIEPLPDRQRGGAPVGERPSATLALQDVDHLVDVRLTGSFYIGNQSFAGRTIPGVAAGAG